MALRSNPKADLASGAQVHNQATITFDPTYGANPPIQTNVVVNTIDKQNPTSSVQALPSVSSPDFTVSWSGTDDSAGIAVYDVYVSVDGGAFNLWQSHTAQTSAVYQGAVSHSYAFYSVAFDGAGHRQLTPASGQALTRVTKKTWTIYLPSVKRK